jgi:hypothetical protein
MSELELHPTNGPDDTRTGISLNRTQAICREAVFEGPKRLKVQPGLHHLGFAACADDLGEASRRYAGRVHDPSPYGPRSTARITIVRVAMEEPCQYLVGRDPFELLTVLLKKTLQIGWAEGLQRLGPIFKCRTSYTAPDAAVSMASGEPDGLSKFEPKERKFKLNRIGHFTPDR